MAARILHRPGSTITWWIDAAVGQYKAFGREGNEVEDPSLISFADGMAVGVEAFDLRPIGSHPPVGGGGLDPASCRGQVLIANFRTTVHGHTRRVDWTLPDWRVLCC
jgi:hypothetical protein